MNTMDESPTGRFVLAHFRAPAHIRKSCCSHSFASLFCSYGLASLIQDQSGKQACRRFLYGDGLDLAQDRIVMIGDRGQDVNGAAANKIPCIGVLYGYGSREELEAAGAIAVCETVSELPDCIRSFFEG